MTHLKTLIQAVEVRPGSDISILNEACSLASLPFPLVRGAHKGSRAASLRTAIFNYPLLFEKTKMLHKYELLIKTINLVGASRASPCMEAVQQKTKRGPGV